MTGGDGDDSTAGGDRRRRRRRRQASPGGLELDLELDATKPPALHDADGWIDFGAGGSSYYYSRTAMDARGQPDASTAETVDGHRAPPGSTTSGATSSPSGAAAGTGSRSTSTTGPTSCSRSSATPTARTRSCTARSSTPTGAFAHLPRDAFTVEVDRPLDQPERPAPTTRPAGGSRSRPRISSST